MAFQFKNIAVVGTHRNPKVGESVAELIKHLEEWGLSFCIEQESAAAQDRDFDSVMSLDEIGKHCDLAVVVGGDGNLLKAARTLSLHDIPVIGINRGQLGYLTDINPETIAKQLKPILEGDFIQEERFLIQAQVNRDGKDIHKGSAMNDIVLFPGDIAQMIEFELKMDETFVYSQRSDGLIISTPTGSTAYNLSAGGPILQPDMNALILVPMFPHTLTSRPVVIDADETVCIHISEDNKMEPRLSFDGQAHFNLNIGDVITITKRAHPLRLLHAKNYDYYTVLREKLHWGSQLVPLKGH